MQSLDVFAAVVGPEPGALGNPGLKAKCGALDRVESILKVLRGEQPRGDDLVSQAGQHGLFQSLADPLL